MDEKRAVCLNRCLYVYIRSMLSAERATVFAKLVAVIEDYSGILQRRGSVFLQLVVAKLHQLFGKGHPAVKLSTCKRELGANRAPWEIGTAIFCLQEYIFKAFLICELSTCANLQSWVHGHFLPCHVIASSFFSHPEALCWTEDDESEVPKIKGAFSLGNERKRGF